MPDSFGALDMSSTKIFQTNGVGWTGVEWTANIGRLKWEKCREEHVFATKYDWFYYKEMIYIIGALPTQIEFNIQNSIPEFFSG